MNINDIIMGIDKAEKKEDSAWRVVDMKGNPIVIGLNLEDLKFKLISQGLNLDFINTLTIPEMLELNKIPNSYSQKYLMKTHGVFPLNSISFPFKDNPDLTNEINNLKQNKDGNKKLNNKINDNVVMGLFVKLQTEDNLW
jgi:hypothetical protein